MTTLIVVILAVLVIALVVAFLQRFYRKASREVALIRTGAGGQRVVMDGGCLVLPFLHRVEQINMRAMRLDMKRSGDTSLMTEDRLRMDVEMEFALRVEPTPEGIAIAAQSIGARSLNADDVHDLFGGRFVAAAQAILATRTMDGVHENRGNFVRDVTAHLSETLAENGLKLDAVSLVRLDQASFAALDENNAFNAVGMRRLAEMVSVARKKRAEVEADADVAVRQTHLNALKERLTIEREEEEAQLAQALTVEKVRSENQAQIEQARQIAEQASEQARINREREVKVAAIERDRELREAEVRALLAADSAKIDSQIALAQRRAAEIAADAETELKRQSIVEAKEAVALMQERLAADRDTEIAKIHAKRDTEVSGERTRSDVQTLLEMAEAEATAEERRAKARLKAHQAEAEGKAALIEAENITSENVMRMKVDLSKIDMLPDLAKRLVKPVEKIDSIRINQVSGLGQNGGGYSPGVDGSSSPVNGAVDGVLNLALQLPAMQKLGQSIGLNLDLGEESNALPALQNPTEKKASD